KFTFFWDYQHNCQCQSANGGQVLTGTIAIEAAGGINFHPVDLIQATWMRPASHRLLFEAGVSVHRFAYDQTAQDGVSIDDDISVLEQSTNFRYLAPITVARVHGPQSSQRFSVSYVTGSHRLKVGLSALEGYV